MIDLYTWTTPNGRKASIMLEECGLPYVVKAVNLQKSEQYQPDFLSLNANGKIPAIVDHDTGETVFESGAIVYYLAEKTGRFLPAEGARRIETMKWFLWQSAAVGPTIGTMYFLTRRMPENVSAIGKFAQDAARILDLFDARMAGRDFVAADVFTIADVMGITWLRAGLGVIELKQSDLAKPWPHLRGWLDRMLARPAVQRGINVPPDPGS
jgi:GSH-dependent disulfide-bond oxidoreductase